MNWRFLSICLFALLLISGSIAVIATRKSRAERQWRDGYDAKSITDAKFCLTALRMLRDGQTNNLLPYIETHMLMVAAEIANEKLLERNVEFQEDANLLTEIREYATKYELFENYKGLLSHESARRALDRYEREHSRSR